MMRRIAASALGAALCLFVATALTARWTWRELNTPFKGYAGEECVVYVETGRSGGQIVDTLHQHGLLERPFLARVYLRFWLRGESLKAGEYAFREPRSTVEVLTTLAQGRVRTHSVTIREGLTLEETAETLADAGFGKLDQFLAAMRSPELILDLDSEAADLEGYLFPETYAFASGTPEREIVTTLVSQSRRVLTEQIEPLVVSPSGLSLREIVILASIVEMESQLDEERPLIAAVYANRLARGIGLYADPTVIFALKRSGAWDGNLRRQDLQMESPYNTYRVRGLPPGPIASPGLASLLASARPADVPYLYFVSRNDGSHAFSKTLAEHNRNVYTWQKKYWRDRWAAERRVKDSTDR